MNPGINIDNIAKFVGGIFKHQLRGYCQVKMIQQSVSIVVSNR